MTGKPMSAAMAYAMMLVHEHGGRLERLTGGFWTYPSAPRRGADKLPEWYAADATIEGLVARGELEFTQFRGDYPIAAALPAAAKEKASA